MNKITWTVRYVNEFSEPYYATNDDQCFRHLNVEEWDAPNSDKVILIAKDFLDAPESEMSLDQIKKDFGSNRNDIPEEKYVQIQNYYNGRLALYNRIVDDIVQFRDSEGDNEKVFHYDIPYEYNSFSMTSENSNQLQGYIEIKFKLN